MTKQLSAKRFVKYYLYNNCPYIYFFNGNDENINQDLVKRMENMSIRFPNINVFKIDWREYILTEGHTPIEDTRKIFLYFNGKIRYSLLNPNINEIHDLFKKCINFLKEKLNTKIRNIGSKGEFKVICGENGFLIKANEGIPISYLKKLEKRRKCLLSFQKKINEENQNLETILIDSEINPNKSINIHKNIEPPIQENLLNANVITNSSVSITEELPENKIGSNLKYNTKMMGIVDRIIKGNNKCQVPINTKIAKKEISSINFNIKPRFEPNNVMKLSGKMKSRRNRKKFKINHENDKNTNEKSNSLNDGGEKNTQKYFEYSISFKNQCSENCGIQENNRFHKDDKWFHTIEIDDLPLNIFDETGIQETITAETQKNNICIENKVLSNHRKKFGIKIREPTSSSKNSHAQKN